MPVLLDTVEYCHVCVSFATHVYIPSDCVIFVCSVFFCLIDHTINNTYYIRIYIYDIVAFACTYTTVYAMTV